MKRRKFMKKGFLPKSLIVVVALFCTILANGVSFAEYPDKPITFYIPLSAGGTSDVFIRTIAPHMEEFLGVKLLLINKPGSNGAIAISALNKSKPDGYTVGFANLPTLVTHPQMRKLTYDPAKLVFVASPMKYEYIFYVRNDAPWNSLEEFIAAAKKEPGKLKYGVPGHGSTNHLAVEWLAKKEGIKIGPIPFKGNPKAIAALLGGHVDAVNTSTTASVSPYQAGLLKPLAVLSSSRISLVPEVKTLKEMGYDFFQFSCLGAVLPPETPEPIRKKLEDAIRYAVEQEDVKKKAAETLYVSIEYKDGKEYREITDKYWDIWGGILGEVGLKMK
jgi:tripartite-type tricarboxylate transporter receptor subunit TctC